MLRNLDLLQMLYTLPGLLLAFSVHEFAHAYAAYKLGDDTAKRDGRLTLDPIVHIDPIGFLMLLLVGFGWAKPVMVNKRNFRHPKRDDNIVSLAGPLSNFVLAILFLGIIKIVTILGLSDTVIVQSIVMVAINGAIINVGLGIFNLLPIPPLDGSHILFNELPSKYYYKVMQNYQMIQIGFLVLLATGILGEIISPAITFVFRLMLKMYGLVV